MLGFIVAIGIAACTLTDAELTTAQQKYLLDLHNTLRSQLNNCEAGQAPVRGKLPLLQWHSGLAQKAQMWADQCVYRMEPLEERVVEGFPIVGQTMSMGRDISSAEAWLTQKDHYNINDNKCDLPNGCILYKQMVLQKTTHVGCGLADCSRSMYGLPAMVVCAYGPSDDNLSAQRPYVIGTSDDCGSHVETAPAPLGDIETCE